MNSIRGVVERSASRIHAVAGRPGTSVRIALPDGAGTLRVVHTVGVRVDAGRLRSTRRRQVFDSRTVATVALASLPGYSLLLRPMLARETALGVVEIAGPTRRLAERQGPIHAIVDQSAEVLSAALEWREAVRAQRAMQELPRLTADLLRARTDAAAVRIAVALCAQHLDGPVAGVMLDPATGTWSVVAANGFGSRRRAQLTRRLRDLPARANGHLHHELAARFAEVCSVPSANAAVAGPAVLLVEDDQDDSLVAGVRYLLDQALAHRSRIHHLRSRDESLDLGIAWTAHELSAPLIGARAALEQVIEGGSPDGPRAGLRLLERTRDELERLSESVDPLLRWFSGGPRLRRTEVDLAQLVREAAESATFDVWSDRVAIEGPPHLPVRGDASALLVSIENLIRNALSYSPATFPVRVTVAARRGMAELSVKDQGPGVPDAERDAIFGPFRRGRVGRSRRTGRGLGLFIARRVAEAHGGTLTLGPSRSGASFVLRIPVGVRERRERSAS